MTPKQEKARAKLQHWKAHPAAFVHDCFGIEPDAWQVKALEAFPEQKRIAIGAAKGPGKTALEAWLILNFLATRKHARVPCTSISGENLSDCLWSELAKWLNKSEFCRTEFSWTASRVFQKDNPETWFAVARAWPKQADATQQANTLAGFHADHILFVLDESGGIPDAVASAAEGALATGLESKILQCGNKTHLSGPLYRAHTSERPLWFIVEVTGDPDAPDRSPRISAEWAREQIQKYGRDHDWVRINVLNEWPRQQSDSLVSLADVEAAVKRPTVPGTFEEEPKILGIDVAQGGDDESVILMRQGCVAFRPVCFRGMPDTMELVGHACIAADKCNADALFVDACGVGAGVADRLRQLGYPAFAVNSAEGSKRYDVRFHNLRAQMWWDMAQWLKGGAIPDDATLRAELPGPTYKFDEQGRYKLERKEDMKKRGVSSPNRADALAYTFAMPVSSRGMHRLADRHGATHCRTDFQPFAEDYGRSTTVRTDFNPFTESHT